MSDIEHTGKTIVPIGQPVVLVAPQRRAKVCVEIEGDTQLNISIGAAPALPLSPPPGPALPPVTEAPSGFFDWLTKALKTIFGLP
jgi:hypothetical protein